MMSVNRQDDTEPHLLHDIALSTMLGVQCFALFIAAPIAALGYPALRSIADFLLVAYVLLAIVISRSAISVFVVTVTTASGFIAAFLNLIFPSVAYSILAHGASIIGFIVIGYVVARAVVAPGPVNVHRLLGAIVLYFNIALVFSAGYRVIADLVPQAFTGIADGPEGSRGFATLIYFSFVTLTSTGYGDVLAIHPFARSLTNFESVIGQLFPATLVARLVAQHLDASRQQR